MFKRGREFFRNLFQRQASDADEPWHEDALKFARILAQKDKQFARPQPSGPWQTPGDVQQIEEVDGGLHIFTDKAALSVRYMTPRMLQIRLRPDGEFPPPFSYAVAEDFEPESIATEVEESSQAIILRGGDVACRVVRAGTTLQLVLGEHEIPLHTGEGFAWRGEQVRWTRPLPPEETSHGLGQRAWGLNLRGQRWQLWNEDPTPYERGSEACYFSIPFYLGLHPDYAIGLLWDNAARGVADLGATEAEQMSFSAEAGELRLYIIADESPEAVLQTYMALTGHPPLPPLWAFGYHQSRWGYKPSDCFRELAREFRTRQIPCDVLHFDIDYMDDYRCFTYDKKHFPDLPKLLKELQAQGFRNIAILDPGLKVDEDYTVYTDGTQQGIFCTYPDGEQFRGPVWANESAFPDFTSPRARSWWAAQVTNLLKSVPFDGLWNDMNEPTVFLPDRVGTIPDYVGAEAEGQASDHLHVGHNVYGMQMVRATRQGVEAAYPDRRPFVLTRATYAGGQRYSTSWTGDNTANWDALRLSISMVLNLNLSGMYFTGPDTGGFVGTPTPEMYARWIQATSMLPFFRTHTVRDSPPQEPWSFGAEVEEVARQAIGLRYRLLPYLYSSFVQAAQNGVPFIRPFFLADRDDPALYEIDDAFMVGSSLIVAPVLEPGAESREVYLPRGVWYNFWNRKLVDGRRTVTVEAPLDCLPLFVRAGTALPMWPLQQYVGQKPIDELQLRAYAGNAETTFYEDAGEGLGYQDGEYRWSYFRCQFLPGNQFGIDWRTAGAYQPPYDKVRLEIAGISGEPKSVLVDGQPAAVWFYESGILEILSAPFQQIRIVGNTPDESTTAATIVRRPPELDFE